MLLIFCIVWKRCHSRSFSLQWKRSFKIDPLNCCIVRKDYIQETSSFALPWSRAFQLHRQKRFPLWNRFGFLFSWILKSLFDNPTSWKETLGCGFTLQSKNWSTMIFCNVCKVLSISWVKKQPLETLHFHPQNQF